MSESRTRAAGSGAGGGGDVADLHSPARSLRATADVSAYLDDLTRVLFDVNSADRRRRQRQNPTTTDSTRLSSSSRRTTTTAAAAAILRVTYIREKDGREVHVKDAHSSSPSSSSSSSSSSKCGDASATEKAHAMYGALRDVRSRYTDARVARLVDDARRCGAQVVWLMAHDAAAAAVATTTAHAGVDHFFPLTPVGAALAARFVRDAAAVRVS